MYKKRRRTSIIGSRGVDPYGTGGDMSPQYLWRGTSVVMSPNIIEVILSSNSNNCCLLYFNANIMCSFTKSFSFWKGLRPIVPQTLSLLLCPPNNPVRSTPLIWRVSVERGVNAMRLDTHAPTVTASHLLASSHGKCLMETAINY